MGLASVPAVGLSQYRAEFPVFASQIYLNTCSLGALSRRSRARVTTFLDEWETRGAAAWYDVWWERLGELRRRYGAAIGADADTIALHASVSTATAVLASTLDYSRRPKIVTTDLDFPTVAYQWLAKRPHGVEVVVVQSPDGVTVPPELLARAVDDQTALVATSHVYFTTGAIQDLRAVADIAHANGALCFIDAYQSVGQIPIAVADTGVDFLCSGGLKWLLGGPGITFLYARRDLLPRLEPTVTGWFAHARQFEFDPAGIVWHDDARRLEQGTPALAAVHAQLGGLDVIEEVGIPRIREVTAQLTTDLVDRARDLGLNPRVAAAPADRSAIVMLPSEDPRADVAALATRQIVTDARPGHVRISPFFYNVVEDHVTALETLRTSRG
ncbi:MAG: aminotransferase class V-fold PLP-dependent enzyme [Gemmatimonadota bacterium]|nr:aminotransferase class V-fold PLP-dependent enzyme [Gemmatimonadota bacterium]